MPTYCRVIQLALDVVLLRFKKNLQNNFKSQYTTCNMCGYVFYKMFQSTTASHEIYPSFVQGAEWFPFIQGLFECSIFQWPLVNPRMGHLPETNMSHLEVDGSCWNPAYFSGANHVSFRECKLVAFSMHAWWAKEKMKFESLNCWSTTSKLCFMYPLCETNHKRHILLQILDILWHFRFLVFESCCFGDQSTYPWKSNHAKPYQPTFHNQETKNSCQRSSSHPLWLGCMVLEDSARGGQNFQGILVVLSNHFTVIHLGICPRNLQQNPLNGTRKKPEYLL